jgi:phage gpG-like protein
MLRVSFEIEGEIIFDRAISRFADNLRDFRQIWPGAIVELQQIVKEQFRGQGVGPSGPWPQLSASYRKWKEKKYPGQPILVRTGATRDALTSRTGHSIILPTETELTFGVALPYPVYHQRRNNTRLPRRPIFDLTEQHKICLVKVVQRRLLAAGRENGVTIS